MYVFFSLRPLHKQLSVRSDKIREFADKTRDLFAGKTRDLFSSWFENFFFNWFIYVVVCYGARCQSISYCGDNSAYSCQVISHLLS